MTQDRSPASVVDSAFDRVGLFANNNRLADDSRSMRSFYSGARENHEGGNRMMTEQEEEEERKQRFW